MSTGVGDVYMDLKLNKQPFERGLAESKNVAGRVGSKIGLALAGAITAGLATIGFGSLIKKTVALGDAVDKMSQKMGMNSATYQEWDYVMQRCGASIDSMTVAMKTLASSAATSKDALAELGISQEEVANLSQEQLFARVITGLQGVEDTTRRTYLAGQLLGRGATELGALLNMSAQDTANLRQNLYSLGGVMSQTAVTNSAALADAMTDLKMTFRAIYNSIAESILPAITQALNAVIIPAVQRACAVISYFINLISSAFGWVRKKVSGIGSAFGFVTDKIKSAFGKKTTKQTQQAAQSIGGVGKSIGGTGAAAKKAKKAVKELTREVMGFDRINKLSKKEKDTETPTAGGGAGGAGGAGGVGGIGEAIGGANKGLGIFGKLSKKLRPLWVALGDIIKAIIRLFKALAKALKPVGEFILKYIIKPIAKVIAAGVIAVLQGIAGAIELLAIFVEKHPKIAATIATIAAAFFAYKKLGGIVGILLGVNKGLMKVFKVLGKANPIILAITAIAIAIGYIYKNWDKIKKTKFGKALIAIGKTLKNIGTYLAGKFIAKLETAKKLVTAFRDAWKGIKDKAISLKAKISDKVDDIGEFFSGLGETVSDITATVTVALKDNFTGAWNKIKGAWDSVKDKAATLKTQLSDYFTGAWNTIKGAWEAVKNKTATATATFKEAFKSAWQKVKGTWDSIKSKTATAKAVLKDKFSGIWNKIKGAWNNIKSKTATLTINLKAALGSAYNAAAKKINGLIGKLPKLVRPDWRLPYLAQGGWVPKNTPQLAVVGDNRHESEIVAPDSKLAAMARQAAHEASGHSDAQVVALLAQILQALGGLNTNVYLDGKDITRNTIKNINQQTRTTGKFPLIV